MGSQKSQRLDLMSQAASACRDFLDALHRLSQLRDRAPYVGTALDSDFVGTELEYMDAALTVELLHPATGVVTDLLNNYLDVANAARNRRVLNQVAPTI
jgi:hypothetical protein